LRLLLDTHMVVWAALDPNALTAAERKHMAAIDRPLVLSAVSAPVVAFAQAMDWELLPLTAAHAVAGLDQPLGYKDPFDEWLLVQAQEEGMRLLTRDSRLAGHPFAIVGGQD
jgi:PIN domain nuclease of toxin-antitoxin system